MCVDAGRSQRGHSLDLLDLEFQAVVSHLRWALGYSCDPQVVLFLSVLLLWSTSLPNPHHWGQPTLWTLNPTLPRIAPYASVVSQ